MTVRQSMSFVVKGPVVEGKTAPLVKAMIRDVDRAVAEDTRDRWYRNLRGSIRHWTGKYGRRVVVKHGPKQSLVTDNRAVQGPWLEGVSRRNRSTRFKGYSAQRRARQAANANAKRLAERVVAEHLREF